MTPYYDDGEIVIYHGDCLEVMAQLADGSASIALTDPPYGIGVQYGDESNDARKDYWPWLRSCVAEMRRVAPVVAFTHRASALHELTEWDWVGCWFKHWSSGARLGNSPILPHWEPLILYGIHSIGTTGKFTSDVWECNPVPVQNGSNRGREGWATNVIAGHPTPKPIELYRAWITAFAHAPGPVLDPFMGSGTTLRAAKDVGRRAIGIDVEERFCEIAARRLGQEVLAL